MKIRGYITHKEAELNSDCQDFFSINKEKKSLAVSDGMAQSIFPQWWAEELANAYVGGFCPNDIDDVVELREHWLTRVKEFLRQEQKAGNPTWMLENCLAERSGAGATLCGIQFGEGYSFKAYILGDSCLVMVDENCNITNIYRSQEGDFTNHPDYFDSMEGGKGEPLKIQKELTENHKLLLVTDALAEFLNAKLQEKREAEFVKMLLKLDIHDDFCALVERWRKEEKMHNDDTTLLIVERDDTDEMKFGTIDDLQKLIAEESKPADELISDVAKEETQLTNETETVNDTVEETKERKSEEQEEEKSEGEKLSDKILNLLDNLKNVIEDLPNLVDIKRKICSNIEDLIKDIKTYQNGKTPGM